MKILHLLKSDRFSGAESVVCDIIEGFREDPDTELVYVSRRGPIEEVLRERGISYALMNSFNAKEMKRIIRETGPDLIHAHDFSASVLAARTFGGRILSHLHNNPPWLRTFNMKTAAYRLASRRFERILTVSDAIGKELWRHETLEDRITVLGNPFDAGRIRRRSEERREAETQLVFLGRLADVKNPLFFVRLVSRLSEKLPEISAVMIGDGELRAAVEEEIQNQGLKDRILLAGFVNNPYPLLAAGRVLVMPSKYEGFGLAALEAMALGKPVVCSGAGGLSGLVDKTCGAVCSTEEAYVKELERLLTDGAHYQELAAGAGRRAEAASNLEEYKDRLKEIWSGGIG